MSSDLFEHMIDRTVDNHNYNSSEEEVFVLNESTSDELLYYIEHGVPFDKDQRKEAEETARRKFRLLHTPVMRELRRLK